MITRVESYNTQQNINFKGIPSQRVIKEIQIAGAKKMGGIVAEASKRGVAVDERSLKAVQEWVNSTIRAIQEYMKGFHDDIVLDYMDQFQGWWIFKNKNFNGDVSYDMRWTRDAFDLDAAKGRNVGWLMKYITPRRVNNELLEKLMYTSKLIAETGEGTVASVKDSIDTVSRWAHQIKNPDGYKKNFKPLVDSLRRQRAAQIRERKMYNKFHNINYAILEPYRIQLERLIDFNKKYSTYYLADTGSREIWHMAEKATTARKKLHKTDLKKYVAQMEENISSMDDYIKSFSKHIYISRDKKLPNAPWEFSMCGHDSRKPISVKRPVTPKPEGELFINTITEDIKELRLNKPEDIERELFDACLQRGLERVESTTCDSFAKYQSQNITLLSQIKELAKRTNQEKQYQQFLENVQARFAQKDAIKNTQAANEALLAQYTKGLIK